MFKYVPTHKFRSDCVTELVRRTQRRGDQLDALTSQESRRAVHLTESLSSAWFSNWIGPFIHSKPSDVPVSTTYEGYRSETDYICDWMDW